MQLNYSSVIVPKIQPTYLNKFMNITIQNTQNGDNTVFAIALINLDGKQFVFRSGIKQSGPEARDEVFSYLSLIY